MIIGIDLSTLSPSYGGGVKTFSLGILKGLLSSTESKNDIVVFVSPNNADYYRSLFKDTKINWETLKYSKIYRLIKIVFCLISWLLRNPRIITFADKYFQIQNKHIIDSTVDALIVPSSVLNHGLLSVPTCLCIHDIQHEYYPDNFSFYQIFTRWSGYRYSALCASFVQVSSVFVKDSLIYKFAFLDESKVFIAPEGVDFSVFSKDADLTMPPLLKNRAIQHFLFYPAQLWPHKNHVTLIRALVLYKSKYGQEIPCILSGVDYGQLKQIMEIAKLHDLKNLLYLGFVSLNELRWLYVNCSAVLSCSSYESSSLPLREASVFGKPLICSDIPPYIEMSKIFNVMLYDTYDPNSLFNSIDKLMNNVSHYLDYFDSNSSTVSQFNWTDISKIYSEKLNSA